MIVNEGLSYPTGGIYLEIIPGERLVFRWGAVGGWPELDGEKELTAPVVTVQLNELGAETELVLTVRFSEQLDIDRVQKLILGGTLEGWAATMDRVNVSGRSDSPPAAVAHGVLNGVVASDTHLLAQLGSGRRHVFRTVEGLDDEQMRRTLIPSGWTLTQLLNHLAFDDEMFWISAVLGGDDRAIAGLHNGWSSGPMSGTEAVSIYKREITRSDAVLAEFDLDLDAPPRWWPPASVFDAPPMSTGREVVFRVLAETSVHAGHLDIVRELLDGRQNLVVE